MKGTALSALFAAATLLASPAFAADDLCVINLQKINNMQATNTAANVGTVETGGPAADIDEQVKQAKDAQAAGDTEKCIAITSKVVTDLENLEKSSNGR
ncbi:hypothetical protein G7Z99_18605 [Pseudomonas entomophila]|uniref:hypothetical protein n=1 Tax=Pseudomonas entomophila TaxID=312306 RepID=UPI0015E48547|nr:hypothetical protein [Pseudomonas entomophila]MBA1191035.1 hypothetical protein [Pseudomonas entomophila]